MLAKDYVRSLSKSRKRTAGQLQTLQCWLLFRFMSLVSVFSWMRKQDFGSAVYLPGSGQPHCST